MSATLRFLLVSVCVLSTSSIASAQRSGNALGQPTAGNSRIVVNRVAVPAPQRQNTTFRQQILRNIRPPAGVPIGKLPLASPLSISRPIGNFINSVQPNPALGFGLKRLSPFTAFPGTYQQIYPFAYGFSADYGYGAPEGVNNVPQAAEQEAVLGLLAVDVTPATAMVFIDNAYVGTAADLQNNGVALSRGRHWLEITASNYDRNLTEILITPGQTLRYRVDLSPVRPAAATPPRPPQTLYAISGCYAGNRPPVAANLPVGCDISRVRVIKPTAQN